MIDNWCLLGSGGGHSQFRAHLCPRYTVMSGTPEKILELLLEAMRPDSSSHDPTGRGGSGTAYSAQCRGQDLSWVLGRVALLTALTSEASHPLPRDLPQ